MGPVAAGIVFFFVGLLVGVIAPVFWWRRQLWRLDLMWRVNFHRVVSSAIAQFFGGTVEDGVIKLSHEEEEHQTDEKKLN